MNPLIADKAEDLARLCRHQGVARLELIGSAARGGFDPASSDLDFLVEFSDLGSTAYADAYFGLLEGLETLFGRRVDLIMIRAIRNPYFLRSIEKDRTLLYAA